MKTYIVTEKEVEELKNKWWFNARLDKWVKSLKLAPSLQDEIQSKMIQQRNPIDIKCTGNNGNGCFMDSCGHNCGCEGIKNIKIMIQKIENDSTFQHRWIEDVKRIQMVLLTNGYNSTLRDCAGLWQDFSDSMCAGWMCLPSKDEDLFKTLEKYLP